MRKNKRRVTVSNKPSTSKKLDTLVEDIYKSLEPLNNRESIELSDENIDRTVADFKEALIHWARPSGHNKEFSIRMSNIGKPARQLWYEKKTAQAPSFQPSNHIRFLYGHMLEAVVLMLVRMAGHKVTDEQKEVVVDGIKGHIDCKINGEVVDIKTAARMGFMKFQSGAVANDDPFGYLAQLASYEEAEGTENGGFLVMSKESGELCLYQPEELEKPNILVTIGNLKKDLDQAVPPKRCYNTVPEGAKGNIGLSKPCSYCNYKFECYADANDGKGLRTFKYANGFKYLTEVKMLPKVEEV